MLDKILKTLAAVAGAIAGLFGEWNTMLTVLVVVMAIDYISGVVVAIAGNSPKAENGGLSSKVGFKGLLKKGMIMLIVLLATLIDRAAGNATAVFQTAATCFYIANEGISILENAALMNVPIPQAIKSALDLMKKKGDNTPEEKAKPPENDGDYLDV